MLLDRLNHAIVRHPLRVLLVTLLVVAAMAVGLPRIQQGSDFEIFFNPDNENLLAYHELQNTYTKVDNVFFGLETPDGKVFTRENLAIIKEITDASWQLPYSIRVDSITNYQHTVADGDELLVDDLVADPANASDEELQQAQAIATHEPQLVNKLISPTGSATGINVTVQLSDNEAERNQQLPEIVAAARALRDQFMAQYPQIRIHVIGKVMNNNAFKEAALYDMKTLVPAAFIVALICIAGYLFHASGSVLTMASGTFSILLVIIMSVLFAMGAMAWLHITLSVVVANAPTMILTLAIADSIHILATFFHRLQQGDTKQDAMSYSLHNNYQPVFLTSITTIVGFLSLNTSDSPPFRDMGNVVAIGVAGAWLFSVATLPALMMLLPVHVKAHKRNASTALTDRLANFIVTRKNTVFGVGLVIILGFTAFVPRNVLNDVWAEYFDPRTEIRRDSDYVRHNLTSFNTLQFSLRSGEENGINDPTFLAKADAFANWLRTQPQVFQVTTFTDVMKRLNKTMHGDDDAWYKLPEDRELAAQYLLLYELSLPFGLDLNNQLSGNKSSIMTTITLHDSSTANVLQLQADAQTWLKKNAPETMYHVGASSDLMFAHMGYSNIRSMLEGTVLALFIISLLLGIALRSVKFGLISLLPNLIPAGVAFGIWGMLVGQIGLGLSAVAGMTLGIVVDYTIHFLSKYLRAQQEYNLSDEDAIRYAFSTVGTALFVTTLILTANFGVLALSDFALNADMGILTAVTIVVALLTDFFFLPPLLLLVARHKPGNQTEQNSTANANAGVDTSPHQI